MPSKLTESGLFPLDNIQKRASFEALFCMLFVLIRMGISMVTQVSL